MTTFKDFLSSNSEDPKMESFSEKIISNKLDRDRRIKYEQILKEEHNVFKEEKKTNSYSLKTWLSIAASVILLAGSFYFINQSSSPNLKEMAKAEIVELDIMADQTVMRKGTADFDEIRKQANQFYAQGDYQNALDRWQLLTAGQETNDSDYLYTGICFLKLDKNQQAIEALFKLGSDFDMHLEWHWIIALAYLQTEENESASQHLELLVKDGTYKTTEAKKLLNLIKE